jgi:hypothetical protein
MQFDEKSIGNEAIIKSIILGFKAMHPLVAFLQEAHAS